MIKTFINEALSNLKEHKLVFISSVFILSSILIYFNLIVWVSKISTIAINEINKNTDLIIEIQNNTDFYQVEPLIFNLNKIKNVESTFVDKNEALRSFKKKHVNMTQFLNWMQNPIPSTLEINTNNSKTLQEVLIELKKDIYQNIIVQSEIYINTERKIMLDKLYLINKIVKQFNFISIIIAIITVIFVMYNVINVAIHSRIQKIISFKGDKSLIKFPFILESLIYSISSILLIVFVFLIISFSIGAEFSNILNIVLKESYLFIIVEFIIFIIISTFTWYYTINKCIKWI